MAVDEQLTTPIPAGTAFVPFPNTGGREVVAWCAGCHHYVDAIEVGEYCPGGDCGRRLRKRVGFVCRICDEHPIFFSITVYRAHLDEHMREATHAD